MNYALTFDIDWAPDWIIDEVAQMLIQKNVKATWFVTHACDAVERLREHPDMFELGIHPNFLFGSTHGDTPQEVLEHCLTLVPDAKSMRTHSLMQSSPLIELAIGKGIECDVSIFLPGMPHIQPVLMYVQSGAILRIPFFWEDDHEFHKEKSCWHIGGYNNTDNGMKVFCFHPIHIYLNSPDGMAYHNLKKNVDAITKMTIKIGEEYINKEDGTKTIFLEFIDFLDRQKNSLCIRDICNEWHTRKTLKINSCDRVHGAVS